MGLIYVGQVQEIRVGFGQRQLTFHALLIQLTYGITMVVGYPRPIPFFHSHIFLKCILMSQFLSKKYFLFQK